MFADKQTNQQMETKT